MPIELPSLRIALPATMLGQFPSPKPLFEPDAALDRRRRRIWEVSSNLHCSIIGTCLTASELRQIFVKLKLPAAHKETDHELHGRAVLLAGKRELASKLLQKALDRRHAAAIAQFARARDAGEVATLWSGAVERADIPGCYWAVLTHPLSTEELVRQVFGEVHMLSHLVGAANRADIRRLRELEQENAALHERLARQQRHLRAAIVSRDATIAGLNDMLGKAIAAPQQASSVLDGGGDGGQPMTAQLIADLRRRLAVEVAGRERTERRVATLVAERDGQRQQRRLLEEREKELRRELELAGLSLSAELPAVDLAEQPSVVDLEGAVLLYVGGRAHQVAQMRALAERSGASLLHHDGGIEDRSGLLEAQVSRADVVFFPVDCVSHNAVATVKRVSRYAGKPYVALRSAGLTSLAAALRVIAAGRSDTGRAQPQAVAQLG